MNMLTPFDQVAKTVGVAHSTLKAWVESESIPEPVRWLGRDCFTPEQVEEILAFKVDASRMDKTPCEPLDYSVTVADVAQSIGKTKSTVMNWVRSGRLPQPTLKSGIWYFSRDDAEYISRTKGGDKPGTHASVGALVTKVERYGWVVGDATEQGEFKLIDKTDILVDPEYQRSAENKRLLDMARDWSWIRCGVISVSVRPDGRYYAVDGQHRLLAAMKRADILKLPCLVFDLGDGGVKEEARTFLELQKGRRAVTATEQFKALCFAGDPISEKIQRLVAMAGRTVGPKSSDTKVHCVAALRNALEHSPQELEAVWPVFVELCDGHPMHKALLEGVVYFEKHNTSGATLTKNPWKSRLLSVGYKQVMEDIAATGAYFGKRGARISAIGGSQGHQQGEAGGPRLI